MKHICCLLLFLSSVPVFSQSSFELQYKYISEKGLQLRILPKDFGVFYEGLKNGYIIERQQDNGNFQTLTDSPWRPRVLEMQPDPSYQLTATEIMALKMWNRKDTLEMAIADPTGMGNGLHFALGLYQTSSIQTPEDALRSGLVFIDQSAKQGTTYTYRVTLAGQTNQRTSILTNAQPVSIPPLPIIKTNNKENMVTIEWPHQPNSTYFEGYFLEKSNDGISFTPTSISPIFYNPFLLKDGTTKFKPNTIYTRDSLNENNRIYYYRLVGIDLFGNRTIGKKIVEVIGVDLTPPSMPSNFRLEKNEANGTVNLFWEKPIKEADWIGFNVYRSELPDTGFVKVNQQLINTTTYRFSEQMPSPEIGKFYKVTAIDRSGNEASSSNEYVYFKDQTPPAIPIGFKAAVDSNGVVSLEWQASQESDLRGYLLISSFVPDGEFMPRTQKPIRNNFFTDTLAMNLENQYYYYQLAAVDEAFNVSNYSKVLAVALPDTLAPSIPLLNEVVFKDDKATLTWTNGQEKDLAGTVVFRKNNWDSEWQEIANIEGLNQEWTDEKVTADTFLFYSIRTFDTNGNFSASSNTQSISTKPKTFIPAVNNLIYDSIDERSLQLSWEHPPAKYDIQYLIFRSNNDQDPALIYATSNQSYKDTDLDKGNTYNYFVVAQHPNGRLSDISPILEVNF